MKVILHIFHLFAFIVASIRSPYKKSNSSFLLLSVFIMMTTVKYKGTRTNIYKKGYIYMFVCIWHVQSYCLQCSWHLIDSIFVYCIECNTTTILNYHRWIHTHTQTIFYSFGLAFVMGQCIKERWMCLHAKKYVCVRCVCLPYFLRHHIWLCTWHARTQINPHRTLKKREKIYWAYLFFFLCFVYTT